MAAVEPASAHLHCAMSKPSIIVASNLKMTCPTHGNTHPPHPLFPLPFDPRHSRRSTAGSTQQLSIACLLVASFQPVNSCRQQIDLQPDAAFHFVSDVMATCPELRHAARCTEAASNVSTSASFHRFVISFFSFSLILSLPLS